MSPRAGRSASPDSLEAAILTSREHFASLEAEWDDLYEASPLVTPFQSWAWLYSWWEHYGEDKEGGALLRLFALRYDGTLVGILPMMIEDPGSPRATLKFVGTGITDYLDLLARPGYEDAVATRAAFLLKGLGGWRIADLQEVRPTAAVWRLFAAWGGPRETFHQVNCLMMEARPWDDILPGLSKNLRSTTKKTVRKANEDGVVTRLSPASKSTEATKRWVSLHRESWAEKNIIEEHLSARFEACMSDAVRRMSGSRVGGISEFVLDGEVIASHLILFGKDFVGPHLAGYDSEIRKTYQINALFLRDLVESARERGVDRISFLRGEEEYKTRWPVEPVANRRILLSRNGVYLRSYVTYLRLRCAYSRSAPPWLKGIVNKLRGA